MAISNIGRDKSFADDLNTERGIVSSRVALLLRSAEIKPLFQRFVLEKEPNQNFFFLSSNGDVEGSLKSLSLTKKNTSTHGHIHFISLQRDMLRAV